ncbi:MAG: response regulator [Anaerolineae bacterium]|nr:response regulator [Anaerolineae bacterium]
MKKILVIEDEQPLLEEILETLSFESFHAVGAPDGRVGLQMVQDFKPDLIISDISMPELDGYSVLDSLRQNPSTAAVPLIFLTAKVERNFMRHGMELGADDYLTKPFTNAELLAAVKSRLQRHTVVADVSNVQVEELKQQLAHTISHELRTPLISISFVQSMLSDYLDSMSPQDLEEMMSSLAYGSQRMGHVVEQMTLFSSLEANLLNREEITEYGLLIVLGPLLESAAKLAQRFVYRETKANIRFENSEKGIQVVADRPALQHALAEIISNALKFSSKGGDVVISLWQDEDWAWISVTDAGIGMPEDQLDRATEAFYQIGRESQEQQGTGLGLNLAQRVVDIHGGTIRIRSAQDKGTRVEVKLPLPHNQ